MSGNSDRIWEMRKYIYDKVYQGYEREISTLWQRSVFLGAFILGISTAFGAIISKALESDISFATFKGIQISLCFVSLLGIIFSVLWICMARASKANQEEFEMRLTAFGKKFGISGANCTENIDDDSFYNETGTHPSILGEVDSLKFKKYAGWCHETNTRFSSLDGGSFSVGKTNIMIGCMFLLAYSVLNVLSLFPLCCLLFYGGELSKGAAVPEKGTICCSCSGTGMSYFDYICNVFDGKCMHGVVSFPIASVLVFLATFIVWKLLKHWLYSEHLNHRK